MYKSVNSHVDVASDDQTVSSMQRNLIRKVNASAEEISGESPTGQIVSMRLAIAKLRPSFSTRAYVVRVLVGTM